MNKIKLFKNTVKEAKAEAFAEVTTAVMSPTKKTKAAIGGGAFAAGVLGSVMPFMAGTFVDQASSMLKQAFGWIVGITTGVAAVGLAIAFLGLMFSTNPQSARVATQWIKRIIIAWIAINLIGVIATTITTLTQGSGLGGAQTTNGF